MPQMPTTPFDTENETQSVELEAPWNPLTVPCFVCDTDYLSNPAAMLQAGARSRSTTAFVRYTGCECGDCLIHDAAHGTPTAPVMTPDTTAFMRFCYLQTGADQVRAVAMCQPHANAFTYALEDLGRYCGHCSTNGAAPLRRADLVRLNEIQRQVVTALLDAYGDDLTVSTYYCDTVRQRRNGVRDVINITAHQPLTPVGSRGTTLCGTCASHAIMCPSCDAALLSGDTGEVCPRDGEIICHYCRDNAHAECHESCDVNRARERFLPLQNVNTALATRGRPGVVVKSVRAVGIEVETSRGEISKVVDAEPDAMWPVIAAVGTDGSVAGAYPVEFRLLPARGDRVEYSINSIHSRCEDARYTPCESAGVHMHVDASDLEGPQVWRAFAALITMEPVLFGLAAEHRRRNSYCRAFGGNAADAIEVALNNAAWGYDFDISEAGGDASHSRYMAINGHAYSGHRTLEVRVFDTAHDADARLRYTLAAALITAVVDYAISANGIAWLEANRSDLASAAGVAGLLDMLVAAELLDESTVVLIRERITAGAA